MTHGIRIARFGGPEVLEWREIQLPEAGPTDAVVRHTAVGLNFIDTYHRSGLYPLELPSGLGVEAAGIVEALGDEVVGLQVGDAVTYIALPPDAYTERRVLAADRLVRIPDGIDARTAAGAMLKGLTAWYLLRRSYPVQSGDSVLLYAAAGGVGTIASQWAASLGARVIGVVSTEEKAAIARANGCAEVVMADAPDFVTQVRGLTGGEGVAAVYDSVGKDTFFQSLDCLRRHGTMVTFGNATGAVEPFSPMELAKRGSLRLTRPTVFDFVTTREELEAATGELFAALQAGAVHIRINRTRPLREAADAHRDLEARRTTGATVLIP